MYFTYSYLYEGKLLCCINPDAETNTTLYTCSPTLAMAFLVIVCNTSDEDATFRLAHTDGTLAEEDWLYYGYEVQGNDSVALMLDLTLSQSDTLDVWASSGDLNFFAQGYEKSGT